MKLYGIIIYVSLIGLFLYIRDGWGLTFVSHVFLLHMTNNLIGGLKNDDNAWKIGGYQDKARNGIILSMFLIWAVGSIFYPVWFQRGDGCSVYLRGGECI